MKKVTIEVELPDELAELLDKLLEEDQSYLNHILGQHLSRKMIYKDIQVRREWGGRD